MSSEEQKTTVRVVEDIVEFQHPTSKRWLILENSDNHSLWAYFTKPAELQVCSRVIVVSRVSPTSDEEMRNYRYRGELPPPITRTFASARGVFAEAPTLEIRWGLSGESVCIAVEGEPWVLLADSMPVGMSKTISRDGKWFGLAWDESQYHAKFV